MVARKILVAGLLALGATGLALADGERRGDDQRIVEKQVVKGHASVEFAAMHNIMGELLSARTGKTPAEIAALFDKGGPHAVAEELGLKREEMREIMMEARGTLITRAQAANLITAQQAERLRAVKLDVRHKRVHEDDGED